MRLTSSEALQTMLNFFLKKKRTGLTEKLPTLLDGGILPLIPYVYRVLHEQLVPGGHIHLFVNCWPFLPKQKKTHT